MHLDTIGQLLLTYRYWILFPLACFEGPILAFLVGTFVALGYFDIYLSYAIMILGDVIPDAGYYFLGRFGAKKELLTRYISKIGVTEEHLDVIERLWHKHTGKTMFFSKLAYGLSTAFLVSAGMFKLPFARFMLYALPVTMLQYGIFLFLGYHFGNSFKLVSDTFQIVELAVAGIIVIAILYYFLTRYMRKRLIAEERREEAASE